MCNLRQILLKDRAEILDDGGFKSRVGARFQLARDRDGHAAQRCEMRDQATDLALRAAARVKFRLTDNLDQQLDGGHVAFRPRALEGELGIDLFPAIAFLADAVRLRHEEILEYHHVEVNFSGDVADRSY